MKIVILGYSGAGKSTFAKNLQQHYQIPLLYLDTIHFSSGWVERDDADMENDMKLFMQQDAWIMEGNYRRLCPNRFEQADQIFIFKINRITCLFSVIKRCIQYHKKQRESSCEGCFEKIDFSFFWWVIASGRTKEKSRFYKKIEQKYGKRVVVFKNRKQKHRYLTQILEKNG